MRACAGVELCLRHRATSGADRPLGAPSASFARYEVDSRVGQPMTAPASLPAPQLALAYALDLLLGDPEWLPHPVRWFGAMTSAGERRLRPLTRGSGSELAAGAVLTGSVAAVGWAMGRSKSAVCQTLLAWSALATRSLLEESHAVIRALEVYDLDLARQ